MLPVVAEVVVVPKLRPLARHYLAQFVFPFVSGLARACVVLAGHAEVLIADGKLMQVGVFPAHDALQDSVEFGERDVASHLDSPPDGWVRAAEGHLDLVDLNGFCQSCGHRHREALL